MLSQALVADWIAINAAINENAFLKTPSPLDYPPSRIHGSWRRLRYLETGLQNVNPSRNLDAGRCRTLVNGDGWIFLETG